MKKLLALLLTVTLLMSVAATASAEWVRPVQTVETWDEEADFVIVGFGLAGAAAAVEAHDIDPEAKVVVLEKMPETLAGGNSIASGQTFIVPSENGVPEFKKYLEACNEPNPIPDEYLDWLVNGFAEQLPWIESVADSAGYEAGYVGGGELKWGSWWSSSTPSPAACSRAPALTCARRTPAPLKTAACGAASPRPPRCAASKSAMRTPPSPWCRTP